MLRYNYTLNRVNSINAINPNLFSWFRIHLHKRFQTLELLTDSLDKYQQPHRCHLPDKLYANDASLDASASIEIATHTNPHRLKFS